MSKHARHLVYALARLLVLATFWIVLVSGHILPMPIAQAKPKSTIVVNTTSDSGPGNCSTTCTLRDAIGTAVNGDTINFDNSLSGGTITLASTLDVTPSLTIDGSALASPVSISGNNTVSVFNIITGTNVVLNQLKIINGNAGAFDGGGALNYGTLTISNSTFLSNTAKYGGGIYNWAGANLTLTNSTFSANSATNNGGAIASESTVTIVNSTFSGNSANGDGGGITIVSPGILNIRNSTFSGNSAASGTTHGGGIINSGTLNYANTIVANSTSGGDCYNNAATITTNLNNWVGDGGCSASLSGDPKLDTLANNGGSTQTFALLPNSPAIDAGDQATCTAAPVSGLDQRGQPRNDLQCDIGAYEMQMSDHNNTTLTPGAAMRTFGPPRAGIQITSGDTGAVTVTKVTNWTTQPSNAIKAWWDLTPTNASGWTANLELCYLDATELNGLVAANLHLWRYSGSAWSDMGRSSASGNCVQVNGVTGFSRWTLATGDPGNVPTAVTLSSFKANAPFDLGAWLRQFLGR